jgi:glycosyltransferase involved in cell wall biosynthesis
LLKRKPIKFKKVVWCGVKVKLLKSDRKFKQIDSSLDSNPHLLKTEKKVNSDRRILVIELSYLGHFPHYIRQLAKYWLQNQLPGQLYFLVSPNFVRHHADVVELAASSSEGNLHFEVISEEEQNRLVPRKSPYHRAWRSFQEWQLLRKYAGKLEINKCLLLYFDSFQAAIASGLKLPCPYSGIYFRPTVHYKTFEHYEPNRKERVQEWREKLILPRVFAHRQLKHLFCLDPFFVDYSTVFSQDSKAIYLPDPVEIDRTITSQQVEAFKQKLGIEANRKVFLLFGAIGDSDRKGLFPLLEAISTLTPELCRQICLVVVGQIGSDETTSPMYRRIKEIKRSFPVQIVVQDEFVAESEVPMYFRSADVILALYQRHVGMSGIVVQGAAAQKPLLSTNYGLMGEVVRRWQLGLTVDSTVPSEIAQGLTQFLTQDLEMLKDKTKMELFARQNSAERFAQIIFQFI